MPIFASPMAGQGPRALAWATLAVAFALTVLPTGRPDRRGGSALATSPQRPQRALCSCTRPPSPPEARDQAATVFQGRAIEVAPVGLPSASRIVKVSFAVTRVWGKDDLLLEVALATWESTAACGHEFEVSREYIVYAEPARPWSEDVAPFFVGDNCNRTRPFDPGEAAALGPGREPLQVSATPTSTPLVTPRPSPTLPACESCPTPPPPKAAMQAADAVFVGEIEDRLELRDEDWSLELHFRVEGTWTSGEVGERAVVRLPWSTWACERVPMIGEYWIVYAEDLAEGQFTFDRCGRSHVIDFHTDPDVAELGRICDPVGRLTLSVTPDIVAAGQHFTVTLGWRDFALQRSFLEFEPPGLAELDPPVDIPCSDGQNACRTFALRALGPGVVRIQANGFGEQFLCLKGNFAFAWAYPKGSVELTIAEGAPPATSTPAGPTSEPGRGLLWLPRLGG